MSIINALKQLKLIILLVIVLYSCKTKEKTVTSPAVSTRDYIGKFVAISRSEMKRTGIPASITLAQGILESGSGTSTLAIKANNHFGIKCGSDWNGKTMGRKDDDYKNGRLKKSCFRKYDRAELSYLDHSAFLMNPNKSSRYGFLFNLSSTDYKAWAKGLQKAGYATSKTYAAKLIHIIEQYRLYQYDLDEIIDPIRIEPIQDTYHIVVKGDTLYQLARKYNTTVGQLKKLNNLSSDTLHIDQKLLIN